MRSVRLLVVLAVAALGFTAANSQLRADDKKSPDQAFIRAANEIGQAEVKLGQLAEQSGMSDAVKKFGARMVEDHSKAGDELKQAASQSNITLPTDMSAKDKATYDMLSKL